MAKKKVLWKAIGCNGNGEFAEFTSYLDENVIITVDLEFIQEIKNRGFNVVTMYRSKDVIMKERL